RPAPRTMPQAPRHRPQAQRFTIVNYMATRAAQGDPERDVIDKSGSTSPDELLQRKEFSAMTPEELAQIKRLIQQIDWQVNRRTTRRRRAHRHGDQLHARRVLRDAARYMGDPVRIHWRRRITRPRPLILIADISGSMEKYARLLLQFLYSVSRSAERVECFVFGTRLTRITAQLRLGNIDRAIDEAARQVVDWAGGTRIGASMDEFNRRWSRRVLRRGAVVILISDGWEQGDPAQLQKAVRLIQHRCHRLIWLNPLLGRATYQPAVAGMHAALQHVDDFLPIHNFQSLNALAERLAKLPRRR
ncbi:MAG: VWA domain-containing protein, partial [Oscillochloris sp.]|nr:VWA domain-containing protein [Oscillochloris sp.]